MQYNVQEDVDAMSKIADTFNAEFLNRPSDAPASERPIFILGLPRSGTTLVDRIVSSHSQVASLGEHNMLAIALIEQGFRLAPSGS